MEAGALISELKRRRVIRALIAYGITAFAVLQIIEPVMHGLHWPDEVLSYVVVALAVGFPIVVSLAWIFDVNAGRIERTAAAPAGPKGVRLALLLVGIGVLAAAPGVVWYFMRGAARTASSDGSSATTPSIAVLPFADMSPGKDQEYFSDGIAEEILNALAQVEGLSVTGRTSSFSFKGKQQDLREIGRKLGVRTVLEGSVRKAGNRVRVTAQVVKVADGFHVWSQTYDRELTDIFAVQDEISRAVVEALKVKLLPGRNLVSQRAVDPVAHDRLLLAQRMWRETGVDRAAILAIYEKVVTLDPGYAAGWAYLATALQFVAPPDETKEAAAARLHRAVEAAEKAVNLDPALADGYAARGLLRMINLWDWNGAKADFERALAIAPGNALAMRWYGGLLSTLGRGADAIRLQRRAAELDPLYAPHWGWLGDTYLDQSEYALAREAYQRAADLPHPEPDSELMIVKIWLSYMVEGRFADAAAWRDKLTDPDTRLIATAPLEHSLGHPGQARALMGKVVARFGPTAPYLIAREYAWQGQLDSAFEWLDKAYAAHDSGLRGVKRDAVLKSLRGDPRFRVLLEKMNLPLD